MDIVIPFRAPHQLRNRNGLIGLKTDALNLRRKRSKIKEVSGYPVAHNGLQRQALAEIVGLTRKTVNGYFAEFEREGLIRRTYASTVLLDPKELRRTVEN